MVCLDNDDCSEHLVRWGMLCIKHLVINDPSKSVKWMVFIVDLPFSITMSGFSISISVEKDDMHNIVSLHVGNPNKHIADVSFSSCHD